VGSSYYHGVDISASLPRGCGYSFGTEGATRKEMISILRLLGRRADLLLRGTTSRMPSLVQGSIQTMSSGTASRVTTRAAPKSNPASPHRSRDAAATSVGCGAAMKLSGKASA
jgi:hypothetical protein